MFPVRSVRLCSFSTMPRTVTVQLAWSPALLVAVTADMAKALGQAMLCRMAQPRHLLCMGGLTMETGMYLDIGSPVGSALPVVVKTLLFDR